MHLAVNYSPQALKLVRSNTIAIDRFKCPGWCDLAVHAAGRNQPVYVHFPLRAGRGHLDNADWSEVEALLDLTGTQYVNLYLAPHAVDFPGMALDTIQPDDIDQIVDSMLVDVQAVIDHFGADRVILENAPWDPSPAHAIPRPAILPEIITHVVESTGVHFALNLAHALMAADHIQLDVDTYINHLPVNHLREIYTTGVMHDDRIGRLRDHFAMSELDWALVSWAMRRIRQGDWPRPDVVTLEYGGVGPKFEWRSRGDVLAFDVPRLKGLMRLAETETAPAQAQAG